MARVLLFGALADAAGWRDRDIEGDTIEALRLSLSGDERLAERLARPGLMTVLNQVVVRGDHPVGKDDEVAFAPPVSGG
ncbi:MoaD/ThiS family protein [Brevundimonas sp.]|uniref:MoaD/ThiS family protein n=1 Tax=Brevundimonas sp. TaxID=1871086 RepID=UPI002611471B|nr:MoaD/ThiS family protein [Brevundimonas sp.]